MGPDNPVTLYVNVDQDGSLIVEDVSNLIDRDDDGIADAVDVCPNDPETFNGFQDEDGCPSVPPIQESPVGGEILGIDITSLFVAGASAHAGWIIPIVGLMAAGIVGFALRRRIR